MNSIFVITFQDIVGLAILAALIIAFGISAVSTWVKRMRCKHDKSFRETRACDAICNQCGKNLGFIGAWREKTNKVKISE